IIAGIVTLSICILSTWVLQNPMSQTLGRVFSKGNITPAIAITFDDGPGKSTDTILNILDRYNARATFFVIGKNAEHNPEMLRKIVKLGHELGNHTYSHPLGSVIQTPSKLHQQIEKTDKIIHSATGVYCKLFRPPHGWRSPWMLRQCRNEGKSVILWSIDSKDWQRKSSAAVIKNVLDFVKPGSVVLFHDRLNTGKDWQMDNTIAALPVILDSLVTRGYRFVTISELQHLQPDENQFTVLD
ncbi:MAG: polysaccharide deacetylase family protein, partial [Fibrobacter sp.]|nr:polysaccharide deacetylase family protein [Fibrobacter sp.]